MNNSRKIKHTVLLGVLTAAALTVFVLEAQFPPLTSIPGIKPGFSNLITLFCLAALSPKDALTVLVLRIVLGGIYAGSPMMLAYSLCGGLCCLLCETLLMRLLPKNSLWAVSVAGAVVHNLAQLTLAVIITKTPAVFWYAPYLIIAGVITGAFNGLAVWYTLKKASGIIKKLKK
ncbi:MAG TPA: Gx transporter family protein [Candidatus Monoglobus merdigallinarum]|uniref:Gx transporter family protein n=1 Tax=Candidatus Monoglobus merdigallinarum TaxID=2838698 RepID=A0A9D1PPY3_9FIRM|nr:Gx transporter family protein [Candidatus Monoglobus merdigallinarum]